MDLVEERQHVGVGGGDYITLVNNETEEEEEQHHVQFNNVDDSSGEVEDDDNDDARHPNRHNHNQHTRHDDRDSSQGKIFVGGVSWETTEEMFTKHFEKYGEIVDSVIMKEKHTRRPRGFGFITFTDPSVIDKVLEDEHVINGRTVEVKRTVPREDMEVKGDQKTKKIFVGGIPPSVTEEELKEYFSSFGNIVEHQIMLEHGTGRSRGFGFVTFESENVVESIVNDGNIHELGGKQVEIKKAEPKRGGGSDARGRYGGGFPSSYGSSAGGFGGGSRSGSGYGGRSAKGYGGGYGRGYGASAYSSYDNYGGFGYRAGFGGSMYGSGEYGDDAYGSQSGYTGAYGGAGFYGGYAGAYGAGGFGPAYGSAAGAYGGGSYGGGGGAGKGYGNGAPTRGRYHPYGK